MQRIRFVMETKLVKCCILWNDNDGLCVRLSSPVSFTEELHWYAYMVIFPKSKGNSTWSNMYTSVKLVFNISNFNVILCLSLRPSIKGSFTVRFREQKGTETINTNRSTYLIHFHSTLKTKWKKKYKVEGKVWKDKYVRRGMRKGRVGWVN